MGDRYLLMPKCAYCNKKQPDVWYAPTCSCMTFECVKCRRVNFIDSSLNSKKTKDVKFEEVKEAISNASNFMDDVQIESCARRYFAELKNGVRK